MTFFVLGVGIFSGFFSGLLGLGGGLIMTPMFLYGPSMAGIAGLTVKEITGLTIVQGFAGAVSGLARHRSYRMVSWKLVRYVGISAGVSALARAVVSNWVTDGAILTIFAAMALTASVLIFLPGSRAAQTCRSQVLSTSTPRWLCCWAAPWDSPEAWWVKRGLSS